MKAERNFLEYILDYYRQENRRLNNILDARDVVHISSDDE